MSRHESRQKIAREFGATDIVAEHGDKGVARVSELTNGIGADSVLECTPAPRSHASKKCMRPEMQRDKMCYAEFFRSINECELGVIMACERDLHVVNAVGKGIRFLRKGA
jgi:threonine dehydrogenase-like Zn-dependent dehydrogenase